MEQHTPYWQEPHPLRHDVHNIFQINEIDAEDSAKYARAIVVIIDVALCGFLGDLQLTFRQIICPIFASRRRVRIERRRAPPYRHHQ